MDCRVDLFEKLPLEMHRYILDWLPSEDLWTCLQVSRAWRKAANDDVRWKELCTGEVLDVEHLEQEPHPTAAQVEEDGGSVELCRFACVWMEWMSGPVTNWKNNSGKVIAVFDWYYNDNDEYLYYPLFASCGKTLCIYYPKDKVIKVLSKSDHMKEIQVPSITFTRLSINKKYIVLGCDWLGYLVYRKEDKNTEQIFAPHLAMGFINGELVKVSWDDWANDCEEQLSHAFPCLSGDNLIISKKYDSFFIIINLLNGSMKKILLNEGNLINNNSIIVTEKFIIVHGSNSVNVYSINGNDIFKIDVSTQERKEMTKISTNEDVLVVLYVNRKKIETYKLKNGEKMLTINCSYAPHVCCLSYKMPETLYVASKPDEVDANVEIVAISLKDGDELWRDGDKKQTEKDLLEVASVNVICNKYLQVVCWKLGEWYIMDINSGRMLQRRRGFVYLATNYFSVIRTVSRETIVTYYG